jgi:hypothetical protein
MRKQAGVEYIEKAIEGLIAWERLRIRIFLVCLKDVRREHASF